jgi:hypothetical protein
LRAGKVVVITGASIEPIALRPPRTSADTSAGRINEVIADAVLHQQEM